MLCRAPQLQSASKEQLIALESGRSTSICQLTSVQKHTFRFHNAKQTSPNLQKQNNRFAFTLFLMLASAFIALSSCRMLIALRGSVSSSLRQRRTRKLNTKAPASSNCTECYVKLCHNMSNRVFTAYTSGGP